MPSREAYKVYMSLHSVENTNSYKKGLLWSSVLYQQFRIIPTISNNWISFLKKSKGQQLLMMDGLQITPKMLPRQDLLLILGFPSIFHSTCCALDHSATVRPLDAVDVGAKEQLRIQHGRASPRPSRMTTKAPADFQSNDKKFF